ncbi:hypothetical protein J4429_01690 [Candidatus Pacearchaeota archaeon]|nr:hypothetical protein [Candidatus Pacearchaeota archaeon]
MNNKSDSRIMSREDKINGEIQKINLRIRLCLDKIRKEEDEIRFLEKQKERRIEMIKER